MVGTTKYKLLFFLGEDGYVDIILYWSRYTGTMDLSELHCYEHYMIGRSVPWPG